MLLLKEIVVLEASFITTGPRYLIGLVVESSFLCRQRSLATNGYQPHQLLAVAEDVRQQYEAFPYPDLSRMDASMVRDLVNGSGKEARLLPINHYIYGGELFARQRSSGRPLRILVAGGGTGRDTAFFARDLQEYSISGTITHVDFSLPSIRIAQQLISTLDFDGFVSFEHASIEDFATKHLAEGAPKFDVISCTGVLHHLDDPTLGLRQVAASLIDQARPW